MKSSKKIAIVTGASSGIGKNISIQLAQNNFMVILIGRNQKKLKHIERRIKLSGNDCIIINADITNEQSVENILANIKSPKSIEVLINNAGIGVFNKIENISVEEWDRQINTNLRASFLMTKLIVPYMIKNKTGKILFINSVAGISSYPFSSAYVASKFGLRGFSSSIRKELREHNIKVISIHPGAIDTPFWENVKGEFPRDEMLSPDDVVDSILHTILAPNNVVCEELIIRRTAGDF